MSTSRKLLVVLVTLVIIANFYLVSRPTRLVTVDEVVEVLVQIDKVSEPVAHDAMEKSIQDREVMTSILRMVQSARPCEDHKCGRRGTIEFRGRSGEKVRLEFLPGHDERYYEFRKDGKLYRVDRAKFLAALRQLGIELPIQC